MSNSKRKYVLKKKLSDSRGSHYLYLYLRGNILNLRMTDDISKATNYGILRHIYKYIAKRKFNKEFVFINTLSITMHFDSKLEVETGGVKGFVLKVALRLVRVIEQFKTRLENK